VWRRLGFSTALEYLEDVFGYAPRTAMERLRVARELGELPQLEAELRSGGLAWSAAKELTRVMTPATQSRWLACARGKNVHDIQLLVSGHKKGDDPDAPKDPALMSRRVVLELRPAVDALFEKVRLKLESERGEHMDDVEVFEAMCLCALEPAPAAASVGGKAPRPMHQIVSYTCDDCRRGWREGRGQLVPIDGVDLELAACDAERSHAVQPAERVIGNSQAHGKRRPAPTLTIPKATRDFVWKRDHGRCRVPGCRATRNLACHHVEFRSQGGDHDPQNLMLLCDGHHKLLHDGLLTINGRAPDQLTFVRDGKHLADGRSSLDMDAVSQLGTEVKRSRFADAVKLEHAKQALVQLGFGARAARAALTTACAHVGADADVPVLVKAVLALERDAAQVDATTRALRDDTPDEDTRGDATSALIQLGYSRAIAIAAVAAASAHVGNSRGRGG
jgi:hypothetical protein